MSKKTGDNGSLYFCNRCKDSVLNDLAIGNESLEFYYHGDGICYLSSPYLHKCGPVVCTGSMFFWTYKDDDNPVKYKFTNTSRRYFLEVLKDKAKVTK